MKKVFIATLLFTTTYGHMAQAANDLPTKEAYKAMLNLFTYNAEGKLIKSDVAFYVDNNGSAVCAYSTLKDATRAEVIDAKGKNTTSAAFWEPMPPPTLSNSASTV